MPMVFPAEALFSHDLLVKFWLKRLELSRPGGSAEKLKKDTTSILKRKKLTRCNPLRKLKS